MNTLKSDFTQTLWTWKIIRTFKINKESLDECNIKTIYDFYNAYKTKGWKLNRNYLSVEEKLLNLKNKLSTLFSNNVDPIQYLAYLCFEQQISIRDISKRLTQEMWLKWFSKSTLQNLLTVTLWFSLKGNHDETPTKMKKDIKKWKNHPLNLERQAETKEAIKLLLEENKRKVENIISFNIEEYETLSNVFKRVTYLLYQYNFIQKKWEIWLYDFVKELSEKWFWGGRISQIFDTIINKEIIEKYNLQIKKINFHIKFSWEVLNKLKRPS